MNDDFDFRFGGTRRLYGEQGLLALTRAHVCVIGIGGVGSWAAEALARSAIGEITLIDMDDVCVSNTNRQIHAMDGTVGRLKIEVMAERIKAINPRCTVHCIDDFLTEETLDDYLVGGYDYVMDAIDSARSKAAIIARCDIRKMPVISIGGAGGQTDPTRIEVADLNRTFNDPLLAKVRSRLKRYYNFSKNPKRKYGVDCVFSSQQLVYPTQDGEVCQQKPSAEGSMRLDCASGFGASAAVTATFGLVAAARIIDKIIARHKRQMTRGD